MNKELYEALILKYKAELQEAKVNLKLYFTNSAGVADHPNLVESVEQVFSKYTEAKEKLKTLQEDYDELIGNERLL
tara:strand:+ start:48 stop:275 length:228 start_codon:yes stop_codon:yes gene_type:complete